MARRLYSLVCLCLVSSLMVAVAARGDTNAPPASSPWRTTPPEIPSTPAASMTNAPAAATIGDAEKFFTQFRAAVKLVNQNRRQDAAIAMDLLSKNLRTSPWMEIAYLKHAELAEFDNERVAEEDYTLLRLRLANAPYFQGATERARFFGVALQSAVEAGINRVRLRRVRSALDRYRARYLEYPESLAKLAILGYVEMENIHAANNQLFRYVPLSPRMTPFISYQRYELEPVIPEPFVATAPRLEGTSQVSESPPKYAALFRATGRAEPVRIAEDQTVQGVFVAAVAPDGVIASSANRILVLLVP